MRNSTPENLEEHTLEVCVLAHALATVRRDVFGLQCDPDRAASAAMFHDASEIFTGDLPTPVKYMNRELTGAYKSVEREAGEKLLSFLPEKLAPTYRDVFSYEKDSELKDIIKAADRLSAYIKCVNELKSGNMEFKKAAAQTRAALDGMKMPEIGYFMENFMPSFDLSLDEME